LEDSSFLTCTVLELEEPLLIIDSVEIISTEYVFHTNQEWFMNISKLKWVLCYTCPTYNLSYSYKCYNL